MLVLKNRPKDDKFDEHLRGYSGAYCYYEELSKWKRIKIDTDNVFLRILFYLCW